MGDPLQDLRDALELGGAPASDGLVRLDLNRERRTGIPEVIMVAGKELDLVLDIISAGLEESGRIILSRVRPGVLRAIHDQFPHCPVDEFSRARMAVVRRPGAPLERTGGRVGIITAGSSDAPYAEQAAVMAREMGCEVSMVYDVGVAGLHRLIRPLQQLLDEAVDVIVVAAGMDGALPSVVTGLVDVPVIGLPTSTGYGLGGQGVGALLTMLQTCVPGLTVVNIDNGVGAGASAARLANRMASARQGCVAAVVEPV